MVMVLPLPLHTHANRRLLVPTPPQGERAIPPILTLRPLPGANVHGQLKEHTPPTQTHRACHQGRH